MLLFAPAFPASLYTVPQPGPLLPLPHDAFDMLMPGVNVLYFIFAHRDPRIYQFGVESARLSSGHRHANEAARVVAEIAGEPLRDEAQNAVGEADYTHEHAKVPYPLDTGERRNGPHRDRNLDECDGIFERVVFAHFVCRFSF
jgi:hypothetical protein